MGLRPAASGPLARAGLPGRRVLKTVEKTRRSLTTVRRSESGTSPAAEVGSSVLRRRPPSPHTHLSWR